MFDAFPLVANEFEIDFEFLGYRDRWWRINDFSVVFCFCRIQWLTKQLR